MIYDVVVIGAGVTGCAIARMLSAYALSAAVLEAADDVAMGSSKANSAIVHSGYDAPTGSLMAEMNVRGNAMMEGLCEELSVHFKRIGSMTLAFDDEQVAHLEKLLAQGVANGVSEMSIETGDWARRREPSLSKDVKAVLWAPSAGINCPYQLTIALAENAAENGVDMKLGWEVASITRMADHWRLTSADGRSVEAEYIVNAAGLFADEISVMAGAEAFTITPRRGEYMMLDRKEGRRVSTVVFQTPTKMGKGVLVAPTVDGNIFAGPTSEDIEDKRDTSTTAAGLAALREKALRSVPALDLGQVITSFTGLRAQWTEKHDFYIDLSAKKPHFVQVAGICSPGLTSAPAIAQRVKALLEADGLAMKARADFNPRREKPLPFREMTTEQQSCAIRENPLYGRIICRCETVTEAEIVAAIHSPVPAVTVDGIKRRTRAGMGRCQGGFCMPRVMDILSRELACPMEAITKSGKASWLTCGSIRQEKGGDGHDA